MTLRRLLETPDAFRAFLFDPPLGVGIGIGCSGCPIAAWLGTVRPTLIPSVGLSQINLYRTNKSTDAAYTYPTPAWALAFIYSYDANVTMCSTREHYWTTARRVLDLAPLPRYKPSAPLGGK